MRAKTQTNTLNTLAATKFLTRVQVGGSRDGKKLTKLDKMVLEARREYLNGKTKGYTDMDELIRDLHK